MTAYSVYVPSLEPAYEPRGEAALTKQADKVAFVKDGFSWLALFVPILWLIYQRMWLELIAFLVVFAALPALFGNEPSMKAIAGWVSLGLVVVFAFEANNLKGWALRRRGFVFSGMAYGRNRGEAEVFFFTRWLPLQKKAMEDEARRSNRAPIVPPVLPAPAKDAASAPENFGARDDIIGSFPKG